MAKKSSFLPEDVHQMVPIEEGDQSYGISIVKLYDDCMRIGMRNLFLQGASGMVTGEADPKDVDHIHKIIGSQTFCRPEDHKKLEKGITPTSVGFHISTIVDHHLIKDSLRWFKAVRFQGDFEKLLGVDFPKEDTGTIAVALAGNMAIAGIVPRDKENCIIMREIKIASMHPDDEHEEPWLAIEFDMYIHNHCFSTIGLPRDIKTGYVPLSALELAVEETD